MRVKSPLVLCLFATAVLSCCGSPGVPLPPSLELAKPVTDLRAVRKGDRVYLSWTGPTLTTDHHTIRHPGATEICRSIGSPVRECVTPVSKVPVSKPTEDKNSQVPPRIKFEDDLSSQKLESANPTSVVSYAVRVLNPY